MNVFRLVTVLFFLHGAWYNKMQNRATCCALRQSSSAMKTDCMVFRSRPVNAFDRTDASFSGQGRLVQEIVQTDVHRVSAYFPAQLRAAVLICCCLWMIALQSDCVQAKEADSLGAVVPVAKAGPYLKVDMMIARMTLDKDRGFVIKNPNFPSLKKEAERGDADAQLAVGLLYVRGEGGAPKSLEEGLAWIEKSAARNNSWAMLALGDLYDRKYAGQHINEKVRECYRKAAALGNSVAMRRLAAKLNSRSKDPAIRTQIRTLYLQAAEHNDVRAILHLAIAFYTGEYFVDRDALEAVKWFTKAADLNNTMAMIFLGHIIFSGELGPEDVVQRLGISWYEKAAAHNDLTGIRLLGELWLSPGRNDIDRAVFWYEKGCTLNDTESMLRLGELYLKDERIRDLDKAIAYYDRAAALGEFQGYYDLSSFFRKGQYGLSRDEEQAVLWLEKIAERSRKDSRKARIEIAMMYFKGDGVEQNFEKGKEMLAKAVRKWEFPYMVGTLYEFGIGVEQNYEQALAWYEKARFAAEAKYRRGWLYLAGKGGLLSVPKGIRELYELYNSPRSFDSHYDRIWGGHMRKFGLFPWE